MRWGARTGALALAVAIGACGGSSGLTAAQFADMADPICQRANAAIAAAAKPTDMPALATYAGVVADQADTQAHALRALKQPGKKSEKAEARAFEDALTALAGAARALKQAAAADQVSAIAKTSKAAADAGRAADEKTPSLGFAECGNGERDAATLIDADANTAAKNSFIAKADAICKRVNGIGSDLSENATLLQIADSIAKALPLVDQAVKDLKALDKPDGDKALLDALIALEEQQTNLARQFEATARRGDTQAATALGDQIGTLGDQIDAKADGYGMKDCGSAGSG